MLKNIKIGTELDYECVYKLCMQNCWEVGDYRTFSLAEILRLCMTDKFDKDKIIIIQSFQTGSGTRPASFSMGTAGSFPGDKAAAYSSGYLLLACSAQNLSMPLIYRLMTFQIPTVMLILLFLGLSKDSVQFRRLLKIL